MPQLPKLVKGVQLPYPALLRHGAIFRDRLEWPLFRGCCHFRRCRQLGIAFDPAHHATDVASPSTRTCAASLCRLHESRGHWTGAAHRVNGSPSDVNNTRGRLDGGATLSPYFAACGPPKLRASTRLRPDLLPGRQAVPGLPPCRSLPEPRRRGHGAADRTRPRGSHTRRRSSTGVCEPPRTRCPKIGP